MFLMRSVREAGAYLRLRCALFTGDRFGMGSIIRHRGAVSAISNMKMGSRGLHHCQLHSNIESTPEAQDRELARIIDELAAAFGIDQPSDIPIN